MFNTLYLLLLIILMLGGGVLFAVSALDGFVKGRVWVRTTLIDRRENPFAFWFGTIISVLFGLFCLWFVGTLIWGLIAGW